MATAVQVLQPTGAWLRGITPRARTRGASLLPQAGAQHRSPPLLRGGELSFPRASLAAVNGKGLRAQWPRAQQWQATRAVVASAAADPAGPPGIVPLQDSELIPLQDTSVAPEDALAAVPDAPGVYAIYNAAEELQYVGISRKMATSVSVHVEDLPEKAHLVRAVHLPNAGKPELQTAWKVWMAAALGELGAVPPGNAPGEREWITRKKKGPPKGWDKEELTLADGVGDTKEAKVESLVKKHHVVAFIKVQLCEDTRLNLRMTKEGNVSNFSYSQGGRQSPECGFSESLINILHQCEADYEVLDVMDENANPGVREIYVGGEFFGGAEIVGEVHQKGELKPALKPPQA